MDMDLSHLSKYSPLLVLVLLSLGQIKLTEAAFCELIGPPGAGGPEFGLIFVPGAQIAGEYYGPLAEEIQSQFPGELWLGLTEGWAGDFPNPVEINRAINQCLDQASEAGFDTTRVLMAGHSLGGIVMKSYVDEHPDKASAILLFGSYLDDTDSDSNIFPVPVLTAVGNLDGGAISYVRREAEEAAAANAINPGDSVVLVIENVNHGQVASGTLPEVVIENDIDAEVSNEEAHRRYAAAAVAFAVDQHAELFDAQTVSNQRQALGAMQAYTADYLEPFNQMKLLEDNGGVQIPWIERAEELLLALSEDEATSSSLSVTSVPVSEDDLSGAKPSVESSGCAASVITYAHDRYPVDPGDFGNLISANVIKAKMKLEDVVLEALCLPPRDRRQCKDINQFALDLALSVTNETTLNRYLSKGRQLVMVDDVYAPTGPDWLDARLVFTEIDSSTTQVQATALVSEPDAAVTQIQAMHYCDLLSPYRALEWIYIKGVQHG